MDAAEAIAALGAQIDAGERKQAQVSDQSLADAILTARELRDWLIDQQPYLPPGELTPRVAGMIAAALSGLAASLELLGAGATATTLPRLASFPWQWVVGAGVGGVVLVAILLHQQRRGRA
jgi:hypothetical protein